MRKILKLPSKQFFTSKRFLIIASMVFISSLAIAGGTVVFYAGEIEGKVTIADNPTAVYNILIDGASCPTTITDSISMMTGDTYEIQHNIKNNEGFAVKVDLNINAIDTGLTINILDGTLNPTTSINIPANSNKWVILRYNTATGLTTGTILNSNIEVKIQPA